MAQINIVELIKLVKEHPDYLRKWKDGVSADTSLYITFHNENPTNLASESYELKNGQELVLDHDSSGVVFV